MDRTPHYRCHALSPMRKNIIKSKRNRPVAKRSYADAAGSFSTSSTLYDFRPSDDIISKTTSCIILSLLSGYGSSADFGDTLNSLFRDNNLPQLKLNNFIPPDDVKLSSLLAGSSLRQEAEVRAGGPGYARVSSGGLCHWCCRLTCRCLR